MKDLYAQDSLYIISAIEITGNKITHQNIILRELTFSQGDSIPANEINDYLDRSKDNVLNTALFNFVTIYYGIIEKNKISVFINLIERWYVWPVPIIEHAERNFGAFLKNPDWDKINYGLQLNWNNFRGRKENLIFKARFGYKEQFSLIYQKPNLGKNQKYGISAGINKFRMHEVNISTLENKPVYLKSDDNYLYEDIKPSLTFFYRNYLYVTHSLMFSYTDVSFRDSVNHIDYLGIPYNQNTRFFSFEYMLEYDIRNSKYYPLHGKYLRISLTQRGVGLIPEYTENRSSMLLYASYHKKWNNHWYHNQAARIHLSPDKREPAYYRTGIGYITYLRGYELYTIEGTSSAIFCNNFKYCISPEKPFTIPSLPWSQFNKSHFSIYANLFVDAGYVRGNFTDLNMNSFRNKWLYSAGIGIDFVTYYDQVLRLESSVNRQGEWGFFIHSEVPFKRW